MLLDKQLTYLQLKQDKSETTTTTSVAHAIFANPKLGALATNARAAYFMVKNIAELCSSYYTPSSWRLQLYEWTPTIFAKVIASYMKSNSIKNLQFNQRCLVAASIFRALDEIKPSEDKIPTLVGLQGLELTCAESLLEYHLDLVRGKPQMLVHENFAVTVTPAMAVILYAMTGV